MPSSFNTAPTSAERRSVQLPAKLMCRICKTYKPNNHYSKKELDAYTYKFRRGNGLHGLTAQVRCRVCAGGSLVELKCDGPCKEVKSLDKFSKNSRANGGNKWCWQCTLWKDSQEHDIAAAAPPETDLAPDEDGGFYSKGYDEEEQGHYYDPEAGDGYDDEDYDYRGTSSAWGMPEPVVPAPSNAAPAVASALSTGLANMNLSSGAASPTVNVSSTISSSTSASGRSENASVTSSSVSNPWAAVKNGKGLAGPTEWAAVDNRRRPAPAPAQYNAWDNEGRQHLKQRYPSSSDRTDTASVVSAASTSSTATVTGPALRSNSKWAKPVKGPAQPSQYQPTRPSGAPKQAVANSDDDEDCM